MATELFISFPTLILVFAVVLTVVLTVVLAVVLAEDLFSRARFFEQMTQSFFSPNIVRCKWQLPQTRK